jgi:hypothetical protein
MEAQSADSQVPSLSSRVGKNIWYKSRTEGLIRHRCSVELAKVDPSVSVMCDVHNTLVNTILRVYATPELQDKYLPDMSSSKVR